MAAHRPGAVSLAALAGIVATIFVADLVAPRWIQQLGLDVWNFQAVREESRLNEEHAIAVEAQRIRLLREVQVTGHTANRLINETITLEEAVDELEPIMRNRVGFECAWPHDRPPTFRHAVARYVVNRVDAMLADDPEQREVICAKLKIEYDNLK